MTAIAWAVGKIRQIGGVTAIQITDHAIRVEVKTVRSQLLIERVERIEDQMFGMYGSYATHTIHVVTEDP